MMKMEARPAGGTHRVQHHQHQRQFHLTVEEKTVSLVAVPLYEVSTIRFVQIPLFVFSCVVGCVFVAWVAELSCLKLKLCA